MGELGLEVCILMDYDIFLFILSNLMMIRDSVFIGLNLCYFKFFFCDVRLVFVGLMVFGRWRLSFVSLSRFISSLYGERSKLLMEVMLDNDVDKKKIKSGKLC